MKSMLSRYGSVGVVPPYALSQRRQNMFDRTICVVAGDLGGLNALLPVLALALDAGCEIHAFLAATCKTQYDAGQLNLDQRIHVATSNATMHDVGDFFISTGECDLLLVGASQSTEGTQAATHAMIIKGESTPIIGVEDMYGSMGPIIDFAGEYFTKLCVIDQFAQEIALQHDPTLTDRVIITGGPQFDKAIEVKQNWADRRRFVRNAIGVKDDTLVFLLAGGVNGSAEMLEVVDRGVGLAGVEDLAKVLLRMHNDSTAADRDLVSDYFVDHSYEWYAGDGKEAVPKTDDLLPGMDFVLSGFSTLSHSAILCEMLGVVYVGTPAFQADLMAEKGLKRPPEVDAGLAWYVQTPEDMARVIQMVAEKRMMDPFDSEMLLSVEPVRNIENRQAEISRYNDGHAAERVWQAMCELMPQ